MESLIVKLAKDFTDSEVAPLAEKIDREDWYPRELIGRMGEIGLLDPLHHGVPLAEAMFSLLQIARRSGSVALLQDVQGELVNAPLRLFLGDRYSDLLEDMASGKKIGSFALSETCCGSDASSIRTRAFRDGGVWRISGEKMWITQGLYADFFLVVARTGDLKERSKNISIFLVPRSSCVKAEKVEVQGNRGTGTARITFEDCEVEASHVIEKGWEAVKYALAIGRIAISSIALGLALGAMEEALVWAKEREAFGKKLIEYQGLQWWFSESYADLLALKSMLQVTCDEFQRSWKEAEPFVSALKLKASNSAHRIIDRMLQVMGGMGYAKGSRVERAYRDVRLTRIGEGTDEIQRMILFRYVENKHLL